ncbi:hypothetical protein FRC11_001565, partial [Ceratobasidium sp. 423]
MSHHHPFGSGSNYRFNPIPLTTPYTTQPLPQPYLQPQSQPQPQPYPTLQPQTQTQTQPRPRSRSRQPIRQNLTYQQKIQVLDFYHQNKDRLSMESMIPPLRAMGFTTICQSTISRFVKSETNIRQRAEEHRGHVKRASVVVLPEVEDALVRWIEEQRGMGVWVGGDAIVQKARDICDELNVPEDQRIGFSRGWLDSFKKRNRLNLGRQGGGGGAGGSGVGPSIGV